MQVRRGRAAVTGSDLGSGPEVRPCFDTATNRDASSREKSASMAAAVISGKVEFPAIPTIPLRELAPWVVLAGLLFVLMMYFVGVEQGSLSLFGGERVHEFVHDARHILSFPCH